MTETATEFDVLISAQIRWLRAARAVHHGLTVGLIERDKLKKFASTGAVYSTKAHLHAAGLNLPKILKIRVKASLTAPTWP